MKIVSSIEDYKYYILSYLLSKVSKRFNASLPTVSSKCLRMPQIFHKGSLLDKPSLHYSQPPGQIYSASSLSVGIHICQICTQRLNFVQISIILKSATSIKYRNFALFYLSAIRENFNRPFGFVGSWLRNTPFQQLWFFFPGFWRTKSRSAFAAKDSAIFTPTWFTTNNNKFPTFWLFFKDIISWEIRALKQYPFNY